MNIYISNLNSEIGNESLKMLFSAFGKVKSAHVMNDVISQESRGFGYVEMEDATAGMEAIHNLDQTELQTLVITVREEHI
jgi:RNA recognition motif-containing protein